MQKQKFHFEEGKWLFIIVLATLIFLVINWGPSFPSLNGILTNNEEVSSVSELLKDIDKTIGKNPSLAFEKIQQIQDISRANNYLHGEAEGLFWEAWLNIHKSQFQEKGEKAGSKLFLAIEKYVQTKDTIGIAKSYELLAAYHSYFGRPDSGYIYLEKAKKYNSKIRLVEDSTKIAGEILHTYGHLTLFYEEHYTEAIDFFLKSYQSFSEINFIQGMARSSFNLATCYRFEEKFDLALKNIEEAQKVYQDLGWKNDYAICLEEKGNILIEKYQLSNDPEDFNLGLMSFQQAIKEDPSHSCNSIYKIGKAFHTKIYLDPLEKDKWVDSTAFYYRMAISLAGEEKDFSCLQSLANNVSNYCNGRSDCKDILSLILTSTDSIIYTGKISLMEANKEILGLKQEEYQRNVKSQQSRMYRIMALIIAFLIAMAILLYQRQRIFYLRRQLQMRIEKLQAQMNPHFISNCLSAIESLIISDKRKEARQYLIKFSRLCRMILKNSDSPLISLERELQALEYYLALEKLRMDDKLSYELNIDENLSQHSTLVPPSFIQPFVENAIWHGIQHKSSPGEVRIELSKKSQAKDREQLIAIIEDDGVGREMSGNLQKKSLLNPRKSMGMAITKERIQATGKDSSLHIEDLWGPEGKALGTRVTIVIPIET